MSHNQFILAYQKGALGCVVGTVQAFSVFFSKGADKESLKRLFKLLLLVSLGFTAGCVLLFSVAHLVWAILGTILALSVAGLIITHGVAELVIDCSFHDAAFFEKAVGQQALIVCEGEDEFAPVENQVSAPERRRAQQ